MKQRGRKNEGEKNKEETEDEHGNKCKVKKTQQHRTKMQAGTYPVLPSIRHVSCILHEGARDCSPFSIWTGTGMKEIWKEDTTNK